MYRIMLITKESANEINNLYKFFTVTNTEGKVVIFEADTLEDLDAQVEKMVNGDYRKKDILVVQTKDFGISADIYESDTTEDPDEPTP